MKRGQFQIQQMAFMIVAVVIFFVLVGLFFLMYQSRDIQGNYEQLQRDKAISSLSVIANMPEMSCGDLCVDIDKMEALIDRDYDEIWPVASVSVYKVYPSFDMIVDCPGVGCNKWNVYDSRQEKVKEYSTYVSLCQKLSEGGSVYDKCEIGKLVVGVKDASA